MTLVVDASVVVAALDRGERGQWARDCLREPTLCGPQMLHAEVANALRRLVRAGSLQVSAGRDALHDVPLLGIELYPFVPFSDRIWELRENLTAYDAWYVAVAEAHDCPLATLDGRIVTAPGPRCDFVNPER